jgi:dihydrolipoamide dehydrogenase
VDRRVDVAIIGAGTAGLSALKEVSKNTEDYVLIQDGPLGTTCARVGCMPSKVLIQVANDFHRRREWEKSGLVGVASLRADLSKVLAYVRHWRDQFVEGVVRAMPKPGDKFVVGSARFLGPDVLKVGSMTIRARRIVVATGSRPIVPKAWEAFGDRILTTDTIFEQKTLPQRLAVIGGGAIGMETGQALGRLGLDVTIFDRSDKVAGLTDPEVNRLAVEIFGQELSLHLGADVALAAADDHLVVEAGSVRLKVDKVLTAMGRAPNIETLDLHETGCAFDEHGQPVYDHSTLQLGALPVFLAGDVNQHRPILHETADDGRIAGYNAVRNEAYCFQRRVPLAIAFCEPNVCIVGRRFSELAPDSFVVGQIDFSRQGRAKIMGESRGILHVYADPKSGELLGSEMLAPRGEHLAHLLALAVMGHMSVIDLLRMPFYHPVIEEGLRTAIRAAAVQVKGGSERQEVALCDSSAVSSLN